MWAPLFYSEYGEANKQCELVLSISFCSDSMLLSPFAILLHFRRFSWISISTEPNRLQSPFSIDKIIARRVLTLNKASMLVGPKSLMVAFEEASLNVLSMFFLFFACVIHSVSNRHCLFTAYYTLYWLFKTLFTRISRQTLTETPTETLTET